LEGTGDKELDRQRALDILADRGSYHGEISTDGTYTRDRYADRDYTQSDLDVLKKAEDAIITEIWV
jgi:hypothetical protein